MKSMLIFFVITLALVTFSQTPQWEFMGLDGEIIEDIAIDDSGNVYVASYQGVYKSSDNGTTWLFKNNGLEIAEALKLFIDYEGNIYLGAVGFSNTGCGLYKSTDGGEYWAKIADTLNNKPVNTFYDVIVIPNEPGGFIFVSNEYGVYRSTDKGITWQSTNFNTYLAIDIGINTNGYMFFGNNTASWFGIYRSTDLGLNWERHTFLGVSAMVYLRDGSVLASAYDPGLGSCGVYKTIDNGDSWVNTNTFSNLSCPTDFVLDTNDDIYAAVGYVFLSTNDGISWLNYGLPGQGAYKLTIDSSGYVWAGVDMDGMYRTAGRTVPVELVSFNADVNNNNNVILNWITVTEINNLGFDIERNVIGDRSSVISGWEKIGFVAGFGTTTENKAYSFVDENVSNGTYLYRLKQIDFDGSYEYSNMLEIEVRVPSEFFLSQNYPNPFNPTTTISFSIKDAGFVQLKIYDILSNEVATLVNEQKPAGSYSIKFDASNLLSGVYFYQLKTGGFINIKKMILLK